ncbi:MAG: UDP-N-acetylmuramoyl-L-alanine--D-glutamate ligase, partial [Brevinematia bacterium]
LEEAVKSAKELGKSGDIVLFSPGYASFDMFKNYEDRGNKFKEIVNSL